MTEGLLRSDHRLRQLIADPRFPGRQRQIVVHFFESYRAALAEAGLGTGDFDHLLCELVTRLEEQIETPFRFEPFHRQVTAPFDYYRFGQDFLRPLVDREASTVLGGEQLDKMAGELTAGENVILLANHQTEADPQAISLLLEDRHPEIARDMIFVAGERVTADPLAVPFSMGRNLLCIYSKRHIDHPPGQRAAKQSHNRKTMERMCELLSQGGRCIYVAPSGGRDRPDANGIVQVAPFDPQSVEMLYLTALRATRPTHFYPMALATYDFLPPPETVQIELGEARRIRRTGIHLGMGPEIDMTWFPGSDAVGKQARREARAGAIWEMVRDGYRQLLEQARERVRPAS